MQNYQRVLAVVDLGTASETIIRHALRVSRQHKAELQVVSVVSYNTGFECDHVPFMTPKQLRAQMAEQQAQKLGVMLARIGAPSVEGTVLVGASVDSVLQELNAAWQPQVVVIGTRGSYGLNQEKVAQIDSRCDVLSVDIAPASLWAGSSLWIKQFGQQLSWQK